MICPHCQKTIREEDEYLMSRRIPKDEPLPPAMRRLGEIGCLIFLFLGLAFALHLVAAQLAT